MIRMALAVALGGAVGSVLRFVTASWVVAQWPRHFYLGTFTVNITAGRNSVHSTRPAVDPHLTHSTDKISHLTANL